MWYISAFAKLLHSSKAVGSLLCVKLWWQRFSLLMSFRWVRQSWKSIARWHRRWIFGDYIYPLPCLPRVTSNCLWACILPLRYDSLTALPWLEQVSDKQIEVPPSRYLWPRSYKAQAAVGRADHFIQQSVMNVRILSGWIYLIMKRYTSMTPCRGSDHQFRAMAV